MLRCKETGETRLLIEDVFPLDRYHKWKHNILGDQRISRENHAVIFKSGSQSMLRDGGSLNGTFLNAKRINAGEDALIQNGDTIAVVETEFTYYESII
jgi:pSer/pThr/pTyr-binding forkhead associated (FHA) protein